MKNIDDNNLQEREDKGIEIDLSEIFAMLLRKWVIIVGVTVAAGVLAFAYFYFIVTPKYTSNARIMVINRQSNDTITNTDLTSSTTLSNDYVEIVKSRSVLEQVIADLDLNYSVATLKSKVSASVVTNTRMISINVTDPDPILAKKITDSISNVTSNRICEVMNIENMVSIVDEGSLPSSPSSPAITRNTLIAALLGFVLAAVVVIIVGVMDDRIKTQEDVERHLGVSVLGSIPLFDVDAQDTDKHTKNSEHTKKPESIANASKGTESVQRNKRIPGTEHKKDNLSEASRTDKRRKE